MFKKSQISLLALGACLLTVIFSTLALACSTTPQNPDVIAKTSYTSESVIAIAQKLSPECQIKKTSSDNTSASTDNTSASDNLTG
jgi:hypothetical protein